MFLVGKAGIGNPPQMAAYSLGSTRSGSAKYISYRPSVFSRKMASSWPDIHGWVALRFFSDGSDVVENHWWELGIEKAYHRI